MSKSSFRDNGYSSLALKRQRQAARAKSREASKLNTPCGTPSRSRAASRSRPNSRSCSRRTSRRESTRRSRGSQCSGRGRGSAASASPKLQPSTNHGYLSAPPSAQTSARGTRKGSRAAATTSGSKAPKSKGRTRGYLALGSSTDDVMAVLQGLGLSRQNSDVSKRSRSGSLQGYGGNTKLRRQRSQRMFNELSELMIMDSSRDLTNIDPSACYRSRKRPAPVKRQSSDLSSLMLAVSPRQSDAPDPDIQAVLDNLPILWEQNKGCRWSQCDDEEMFKPNVSFKSLVHVAKWCQRIRNRVPRDRRGSI